MRAYVPLWPMAAVLAACGSSLHLETRTFELKHLDEGEASRIIAPYVYTDRPGAPGVVGGSGSTLTVRETHDNLERIARVLEQFDAPRPTVRLTFRLIQADGTAEHDSAIADVEATLRKLFVFRGYRLVGQGVVSGAEGSDVSQPLGGAIGRSDVFQLGGPWEVGAQIGRVMGRGDSALVQLHVRLNLNPEVFQTGLDVPLGKTVVLGNVQSAFSVARASGERDVRQTTLILTVRPELVSASP